MTTGDLTFVQYHWGEARRCLRLCRESRLAGFGATADFCADEARRHIGQARLFAGLR